MNYYALFGVLALVYAVAVVFIALKKPSAIWNMGKIKFFRNHMGEKGTVIFFYVWAVLAVVLGVWLLGK